MRPWNPNTKSTGQPGDWTPAPPTDRPGRCALCLSQLSHRGRPLEGSFKLVTLMPKTVWEMTQPRETQKDGDIQTNQRNTNKYTKYKPRLNSYNHSRPYIIREGKIDEWTQSFCFSESTGCVFAITQSRYELSITWRWQEVVQTAIRLGNTVKEFLISLRSTSDSSFRYTRAVMVE